MDSLQLDLPGTKAHSYGPGEGLPLFVTAETASLRDDSDAVLTWLASNRVALDAATTLSGAIVLRSFAIHSTPTFSRLADLYAPLEGGYAGGMAPRSLIEGRAFESTRAPRELRIGLHQEMAYAWNFPERVAFFCVTPAESGGETTIGDMRQMPHLLPEFANEVAERGVLYLRRFKADGQNFSDPFINTMYRSWSDSFGTDNRGEVDRACTDMHLETEWLDDGGLCTRFRAPGFVTHPTTRQHTWFNQLAAATIRPQTVGSDLFRRFEQTIGDPDLAWTTTRFGDGGRFDDRQMDAVYAAFDGLSVNFPWQHGDVMLVDNVYTAHGRQSFVGDRETQVALLGSMTYDQ